MSEHERSNVSRRQFVRLGLLGATAAAGCAPRAPEPGPPSEAAGTPPVEAEAPPEPAPPPKPYGRYQMGMQSYSFRKFTFEEAVAKAADLGLHYIEPFPGHFRTNSKPDHVKAVQDLCEAKQVTMNAYGVCRFGPNEGAARKIFDFCKRVDIGCITAAPAPKAMDMLDKLVEEYDVQIAIHNHGPGDKKWGKLAQLLDGTKGRHPHIGVCLDTGHLARAGDDPVKAIRVLGSRVHALHLKDWNQQKHDVVIGQGVLDLDDCFAALEEVAFDGPCSVEYEIDANKPSPGIAASLEAVRATIARVG